MPTIGVVVTTSEVLAVGGVPTNSGTGFFVGLADRGPTSAVLVVSMPQFVASFGPRTVGNSALYDAVETFLREGPSGVGAYVARVTDNTGVAAAETLNDALPAPKPTVLVTALTAGTDGNLTYVHVTNSTAATFTATTATNTTLSAISSFTNLAAGVKVTGTGISAGTYIVSVNTGAATAVLSQATTASAAGVTITPATFTVLIEDSAATVLETHGPYATTAQLYADTGSGLVVFSQSAGSGFTINQPTTQAATALTGGLDATDLTDASFVTTANAAFGPELGPGQIGAPGKTTSTVWTGLLAHAAANNRHACLDIADQSTAAAVLAQMTSVRTGQNAGYGEFASPQCTIPGITPGTSRTVAASAVAMALCARVHATGNDNQAPAGVKWPLQFVTGFTVNTSANGGWNAADYNTLINGGVNAFTVRNGVPCLFGFVTPVAQTADLIFWSAAASRERMALVVDVANAAEPFVFDTIDGKQVLLSKLQGDLQGVITNHWSVGALFGETSQDAGRVDLTGNTLASEQAGQLIAVVRVRISPYAEAVEISIVSVPITQVV